MIRADEKSEGIHVMGWKRNMAVLGLICCLPLAAVSAVAADDKDGETPEESEKGESGSGKKLGP